MLTHTEKLVRGTSVVFISMMISTLLGFGQKIVFSRSVTLEGIGLFYSCLGFVSFFMFLRDLGVSDSLIYFIPRYIANRSLNKIKSIIIVTFYIQLILGISFQIIIFFSAKWLAKNYFNNSNAYSLLILLSIYFLSNGIQELLQRLFHSYQNMTMFQLQEISFQVFTFIGLLFVIKNNRELSDLGFVYILSSISVSIIFIIVFVKLHFQKIIQVKSNITKNFVKKILKYSIPTMTGTLADQIFAQQTILLLTFLLGLESVGLYIFALSLAKILMLFVKPLSRTFYPQMSELWSKNDLYTLNNITNGIIKVISLFIIPGIIVFLVFGRIIISVIYGENFIDAASLLGILSIYVVVRIYTGLLKRLILTRGHPVLAQNSTLITLVTNLIFNVLLIPKIGLLGAGVADLISSFFGLSYIFYFKSKLNIALNFRPLMTITFLSVSVGALWYIFNLYFIVSSIYMLLILLFIGGSIYLLLLILFKVINIREIVTFIENNLGKKTKI